MKIVELNIRNELHNWLSKQHYKSYLTALKQSTELLNSHT